VFSVDAFEDLLEAARIQQGISGIALSGGSEMVNNHLVDDSHISV
jgi:hypothetical protein